MLGDLHVVTYTMGCVHGSSNEIQSEWDPGPSYLVQRLWDPVGPHYTYPTLHLSTPSDTQNTAIAVSSFSSITTWTFLSQTTTSSWRTLPQMTCSSQEHPLVGDSIPKILIVRPQGCCAILQVIHQWNPLIIYFFTVCFISRKIHSFRNK